MSSERNDYRTHRRAFIAACEAHGLDAIARVQPDRGDDGKPLFTDTVALGERLAARAVLVVGNDANGSAAQIDLLGTAPPPGERLVLVHALDPGRFGGPADSVWATTVLAAVAAEDLSRVGVLTVMDMTGGLEPILRRVMPHMEITVTDLSRLKF
ncbi:MAG: hypothetical protein JWN16_1648 [Alphaproteobacteria bacterium]|nr:hypothetical protein [Alphaproteobacteria bacterium]